MAPEERSAVHAQPQKRTGKPGSLSMSRATAEAPLPATIMSLQRAAGNQAVTHLLQRWPMMVAPPPAAPATLTDAQLATAKTQTTGIGPEAMDQLQEKLGVTSSGTYNNETAQAVYQQQRAWQPTGAIAHPGVADDTFFSRLGLVRTGDFDAAPLDAHVEARALAHQLA